MALERPSFFTEDFTRLLWASWTFCSSHSI